MPLLVKSASGANGDDFGALLSFELDGTLRGTFIDDDRIVDPRGLAVDPNENLLFLNRADRVLAISSHGRIVRDTGRIEGLNPGGGIFGPDGRYFVGLRSERTIVALSTSFDAALEHVLPPRVVPFPRGFAFGQDGRLFLASGIAPNGNILVSSERPFGAVDAVTSVREYDAMDGHLVRVFSPKGKAEFCKPRGLRFGPGGLLYCVARNEVVAFDFASGECLGAIARLPQLNGQALVFFP
jgi:hypothetical protein